MSGKHSSHKADTHKAASHDPVVCDVPLVEPIVNPVSESMTADDVAAFGGLGSILGVLQKLRELGISPEMLADAFRVWQQIVGTKDNKEKVQLALAFAEKISIATPTKIDDALVKIGKQLVEFGLFDKFLATVESHMAGEIVAMDATAQAEIEAKGLNPLLFLQLAKMIWAIIKSSRGS